MSDLLKDAYDALFANHVLIAAVKGNLKETYPDSYSFMQQRWQDNLPLLRRLREAYDSSLVTPSSPKGDQGANLYSTDTQAGPVA